MKLLNEIREAHDEQVIINLILEAPILLYFWIQLEKFLRWGYNYNNK